MEKAKAEQATVQAQTKAEWADVKVLKDKLAAENCRNEAEASELENDQLIVKKQLAELAVREKIVLKQAEKYADHEHTLSKVEKEIESLKASVLADQTHLAQELATVEKLKAEQAADQTKTKAEWAEIKIIQAKMAAESKRIEADAVGLEESLAEQAKKVADLAKRAQVILSQESALETRALALKEEETRVVLVEGNAVAPLVAQYDQRAAALAAREQALAAKEKEVTKLLARLEAEAEAAAEEQSSLVEAKIALEHFK